MLTPETRLVPQDDVIHTTLVTGEAVLLDLTAQRYFSLNQTGAEIWKLLSEGKSLGQVREDLELHYQVTAEQAERSVMELVNELVAEHLLAEQD